MTALPPPQIRLLDAAPPTLSRPLALLKGHDGPKGLHAYAAAWPLAAHTTTTRWDPQTHQPVPLPEPITHTRQDLLILRDDGLAFGPGGDQPLDQLGLQTSFPVIPPSDRQWSPAGLAAYRAGRRPDPALVFNQVADVVDTFVDFERSLGPQRLMCELCAAFILSTWLADAFHALGFLWLTGEHRRAPVQLLHTLAQLAHLGAVAPSGALSPALRGLAGLGATLAFDEPDGAAVTTTGASEWRTWLLAGSERGAAAVTRAYDNDRKQSHARPISVFCPRLFAAPRLPDARLAPHTIVIPLVRTADPARLARQPHDPAAWPIPQPALQDDLYALALASLPALPAYDRQLPHVTRVPPTGLDPWRALLAVALWLTDHGLPGLFDRLDHLAVGYQTERQRLETDDLTLLLIRSIITTFAAFTSTAKGGPPEVIYISTRLVISAAELSLNYTSAINQRDLTPNRVGRFLASLRLVQRRMADDNSEHARVWGVTLSDIQRWSNVYGLPLPDSLAQPPSPAPAPSQSLEAALPVDPNAPPPPVLSGRTRLSPAELERLRHG